MKSSTPPPSTVCYEVTVLVETEISTRFLEWLRSHVQQILEIEGFTEARMWRVEASPGEDEIGFVVQYFLAKRKDLELYFKTQAPRLRSEGEKKFGGQMKISRRILTALP